MGKRGPVTFAKRQREKDKKANAEPTVQEILICKPFVDEPQN